MGKFQGGEGNVWRRRRRQRRRERIMSSLGEMLRFSCLSGVQCWECQVEIIKWNSRAWCRPNRDWGISDICIYMSQLKLHE
jgi:hypothetical protein